MRTALVIGGRPDYAGPAVRILPRTGARVYLSERWKVDDLINNNDRQQQLIGYWPPHAGGILGRRAASSLLPKWELMIK